MIENNLSRKAFRRNWARLIKKIYNSDLLVCPKCNGNMKIIAFIEEEDTIRQILKHLGLWLPGNHDPPEQKASPVGTQIFNMIEMDFNTSLQAIREEIIPQMPYEDDYSQITPYDDECRSIKDIFIVNPNEKHVYTSNYSRGMNHFTVNFYLVEAGKNVLAKDSFRLTVLRKTPGFIDGYCSHQTSIHEKGRNRLKKRSLPFLQEAFST